MGPAVSRQMVELGKMEWSKIQLSNIYAYILNIYTYF